MEELDLSPRMGGRPLVIPEKLDGTWVLQYLAPAGISPHLVSFRYEGDELIVEYSSHHTEGVNFTLKQKAVDASYKDGILRFKVLCGGPGNELFGYYMEYYRGDVMLGYAQRVDMEQEGFKSPLYAKFIHE